MHWVNVCVHTAWETENQMEKFCLSFNIWIEREIWSLENNVYIDHNQWNEMNAQRLKWSMAKVDYKILTIRKTDAI